MVEKSRGRDWRGVLDLLNEMHQRGVVSNVVNYNTAISACGKCSQLEKALEIFGLMQERGAVPDVVTYNTSITACEKGGQWEKALEIFGLMQGRGVAPDVVTYNTLITAFEKGGQWEKALGLFRSASQAGFYDCISVDGSRSFVVDLHGIPAAVARVILCATMDQAREGKNGSIVVITGRGVHSVGAPVLPEEMRKFSAGQGWEVEELSGWQGLGRFRLRVG